MCCSWCNVSCWKQTNWLRESLQKLFFWHSENTKSWNDIRRQIGMLSIPSHFILQCNCEIINRHLLCLFTLQANRRKIRYDHGPLFFVLQVLWTFMFKYANNSLSHYIFTSLHTFPEQKSEYKARFNILVSFSWHIRVKGFYRGNFGCLFLWLLCCNYLVFRLLCVA